MDKVIKRDFRPTKEFQLPLSSIKITCYASLLVSEVNEVTKNDKETDLNKTLGIICKASCKWNYFANETDALAMPLTPENFLSLPATDVEWLITNWSKWSEEVKKKQAI